MWLGSCLAKLLLKFRKNVFPKELTQLAWDAFHKTAAASRNRGAAAGPIDTKSEYWKKRKPVEIDKWGARYVQNGKVSKMKVNNNVFSSVLGYFEQTPFMGLPCRLTSYTQTYFKYYKMGIPFMVYSSHVNYSLIKELKTYNITCYISKGSKIDSLKEGLKN